VKARRADWLRAPACLSRLCGGGLHGLAPRTAARNLVRLARGALQVWKLSREWKPEVLLVTGGFVSAPVALVCWLRGADLGYLPDIELGWPSDLSADLRHESLSLPKQSRILARAQGRRDGVSVRQELVRARSAGTGADALGLDASLKTVLVLGEQRRAVSIARWSGAGPGTGPLAGRSHQWNSGFGRGAGAA